MSSQLLTVLQICLNAVGVLGGMASDGLIAPPLSALLVRLGLSPAGRIAESDPLGARTPLTPAASTTLPSGTFGWRWVE